MPGATATATRTQTGSLETSLGGLDADFVLQVLVRALRVVPFRRVSKGRQRPQASRRRPTACGCSEDVYGPLQAGSRSESNLCGPKSSRNASFRALRGAFRAVRAVAAVMGHHSPIRATDRREPPWGSTSERQKQPLHLQATCKSTQSTPFWPVLGRARAFLSK